MVKKKSLGFLKLIRYAILLSCSSGCSIDSGRFHGGERLTLEVERRGELAQGHRPSYAVVIEERRINDWLLPVYGFDEPVLVRAFARSEAYSSSQLVTPRMYDTGGLLILGKCPGTIGLCTSSRSYLTVFAQGFFAKTVEISEIVPEDDLAGEPALQVGSGRAIATTRPDLDESSLRGRKTSDGIMHCRIQIEALPSQEEDANRTRDKWYGTFSNQLHWLTKAIRQDYMKNADLETRRTIYGAVKLQNESAACVVRTGGADLESVKWREKESKRRDIELQTVAKWAQIEVK